MTLRVDFTRKSQDLNAIAIFAWKIGNEAMVVAVHNVRILIWWLQKSGPKQSITTMFMSQTTKTVRSQSVTTIMLVYTAMMFLKKRSILRTKYPAPRATRPPSIPRTSQTWWAIHLVGLEYIVNIAITIELSYHKNLRLKT
jgi:hypothetical protein